MKIKDLKQSKEGQSLMEGHDSEEIKKPYGLSDEEFDDECRDWLKSIRNSDRKLFDKIMRGD